MQGLRLHTALFCLALLPCGGAGFALAAQTGDAAKAQSGEGNLSSNTSAVVANQQAGQNQVKLIPAQGPVDEEIRIVGSGLPSNQPVSVLGGVDPGQVAPVTEGTVDTSGAFRVVVKMTAKVENGQNYYFVLKVGDRTLQPLAYQVASRAPAPAKQ